MLIIWKLSLSIQPVFADTPNLKPIPNNTAAIPNGAAGLVSNIGGGIGSVLEITAGVAAVIFIIWNGIRYITAGGDTEKAKSARTGIINAVIGIVVVIAAYAIISIAYAIANSIKSTI
jgi:hypothetical protein